MLDPRMEPPIDRMDLLVRLQNGFDGAKWQTPHYRPHSSYGAYKAFILTYDHVSGSLDEQPLIATFLVTNMLELP